MKRYTNHSQEMRAVHFEDGSTQFLFRGQSFQSDVEPARIEDGIRVKVVKESKPTRTKSTPDTEQSK